MHWSDFHWSDMIVKVVAAIVILIITALIAKVVKSVLSKQLSKVHALNRHEGGSATLAESLGSVASLIVWLFGLMAVLNLFALTGVITPLQHMLNQFLGALPGIIGAALVLFVGFMLAKIVRELVETALNAANVDRFASRLGSSANRELDPAGGQANTLSDAKRKQSNGGNGGSHPLPTTGEAPSSQQVSSGAGQPMSIAHMVGQVVFAVILLVVAIAALQLLGIKAISDPATHMLQMILDAIPAIIGAGILLAIGVVIAKFVGTLLDGLLHGLNIDSAFAKLGVDSTKTDVAAIITRIVQIAIVLFFAVAATNLLGFPQITQMLNTVLALGGKVVFGAVVIVAGIFIANLIAGFVSGQTAKIVRVATIVLFVAMGLKYMGLADSIVNLAFGALVVGGAAAAALAFGIGGRDAAARQLEKMQNNSGSGTKAK